MIDRRASSWRRHRWGGILFEIVLAASLFAGAAAFTLAAVSSVFDTLDRTARQQQAVDLARTKMAELEAGLISLAELRSMSAGTAIAMSGEAMDDRAASALDNRSLSLNDPSEWTFDVKVRRSEFTNFSLVELTVSQPAEASGGQSPIAFTLRQLVRFGFDAPGSYESDDLLEDLQDE